MTDIAGVVRTISFQTSAASATFIVIFSTFNWAHHLWRYYRKAEIYSNPHNFLALAKGHLAHTLGQDKLLVKIPAMSVLVAHRIMLVVDQIYRLQDCFRKLENVVELQHR